MRIDNWPLDRIMRLPDWCFGRRWWVGEYMGHVTGGVYYRFGEEQLPDKFVLWGVYISCLSSGSPVASRVTIRLGHRTPTSAADANTMERLLKGISIPTITYEFFINQNGVTWLNGLRQIVESAGRRLALVSNGAPTIAYEMTVAILISAMPKEVPDWLISGRAEKL